MSKVILEFQRVEHKIKTAYQDQTTTIRKGIKYRSSECNQCIHIEVLLMFEFSPYYWHLIFMRVENRYPNFMRRDDGLF